MKFKIYTLFTILKLHLQEALRDLNEELEESHIQTEKDLREEIDMSRNKVVEVIN